VLFSVTTVGSESIITNQKKAEERAAQMEKLSITDPLTGLYNRQYFEAKFTEELSRCSSFRIPLRIFILDIDNFKSINDNYGHTAGDACLQQIGLTLKAQVPRITDSVVRYGGDEFIILLPGADQTIASKMAESLRIAIKDISPQWNEGSSISCSLGAATYVPPPKTTGEKILKAADDALYQAKRLGRNRCCFDKSLAKLKVLASEDRTILNS
jgi:diguanylate cyclase (GGDEF)-like protein